MWEWIYSRNRHDETAFLGVGYMHTASLAAAESIQPSISTTRGAGIAVETFTVAGTTYSGFAVEAGSYFCDLKAASTGTATIRQHTAFPTTAGEISKLGSSVSPGAMIRTLADRKLWATASAAVSAPTFRVRRLE